jgi:hypothetical protein
LSLSPAHRQWSPEQTQNVMGRVTAIHTYQARFSRHKPHKHPKLVLSQPPYTSDLSLTARTLTSANRQRIRSPTPAPHASIYPLSYHHIRHTDAMEPSHPQDQHDKLPEHKRTGSETVQKVDLDSGYLSDLVEESRKHDQAASDFFNSSSPPSYSR